MTKQEYISAVANLIDEAKKDENFVLVSILYTLQASLIEDSLEELSNYTIAFSQMQIDKYRTIQN